MTVSIVIPIYNNFSLINDLLAHLHMHTRADEVIVVDDCSPDQKTQDGIRWWELNANVKVVRTTNNLGFLKASNFGISKTTGDIIALISSDVVIEMDLCTRLREIISNTPNALIGGVVYEDSTGWNEFGGKVFPYAEGWLLAAHRDVWLALGNGFDERFAPNDFEDVDLSTTALHTGVVLRALNSPDIRHLGAKTIGYTEERRALTERNRRKFEEKWITKLSVTV